MQTIGDMKYTIDWVGFTGLAGSGKSEAASALTDRDYDRASFARPLKDMLTVLGVDCRDKEARPPVLCGKTVRHAMQTLGTEWGRQWIGPDIWVNAAMLEAEIRLPVVFDDVRFENEALAILQRGGMIIRVIRPGVQLMDHASEAGISSSLIRHTIYNDGTAEELKEKVIQLVYGTTDTSPIR